MKGMILLSCLAIALFFTGLGSRDFWAPDEGDFAQVARELEDDFVVPRLNGKPYAEKPPLYYYVLYASGKIQPWLKEEISFRVPSALFALALACALFATVAWLSDRKRALYASLIFVSSPLVYWQARYVQVDMVFSAFLCLSLFSFLWFFAKERTGCLYLCAVFLGGAFLTKGPLALVLTLPPMLAFSFLAKRKTPFPLLHAGAASLLFAAIVMPWYVAVYLKEGPSFLYENVVRQNLLRFSEAWSHRRPFYYYLTTLPMDFLPWSLFLPLGIYRAFKERKESLLILFLLIFSTWAFLFLSVSSGKISKYMLPLVPALSVFSALALEGPSALYQKIVGVLLSTALLVAAGVLVAGPKMIPAQLRNECILFSVLFAGGGVAILFAVRRSARDLWVALFSLVCASFLLANIILYEKIDSFKSPRPLAAEVKRIVSDGRPWLYYGSMRGVYVYYVGQRALHVDEHDTKGLREVGRHHGRLIILTRKRDLREVSEALSGAVVLAERKVGGTDMVILEYRGGKS